MIAITPLLHEIIPHGWYRISLLDPDCSITAAYSENPAAHAVFRERVWKFMDDPTALVSIVMPSFYAIGIGWTLHLRGHGYLESAYYRETEALLDACWVLDAMVGDEGQAIAGLQLTRPRSARPFTADDVQRLDRLRPWLAHALRRNGVRYSSPREHSFFPGAPVLSGQMILTSSAKLLFQSSEVDFLRQVVDGNAYCRVFRDGPFRWGMPREVPSPVQKLDRRLLDAADGNVNSPPRMGLSTAYGGLTLEAKWLAPQGANHEDIVKEPKDCLIAVTIELHEHTISHAARVLRENGATPAQVRTGIELARGRTKSAIASELGVEVSSVEDLTKKLYRRLDIHNVAELAKKLWLDEFAPAYRHSSRPAEVRTR